MKKNREENKEYREVTKGRRGKTRRLDGREKEEEEKEKNKEKNQNRIRIGCERICERKREKRKNRVNIKIIIHIMKNIPRVRCHKTSGSEIFWFHKDKIPR